MNNDGQNLFHKIHTDDSSPLYALIEYDILNLPIVGMVDYKTHNYTACLPNANVCEPKIHLKKNYDYQ